MKKAINILCIALIVLIVAQIGLMLLPYFHFELRGVEDKTAFSIQDYAWVYTEEMTEHFEGVISGYKINDYALGLVLAFLMAIVALLFNVLSKKRGLFTHAFSIAWGVAAFISLLSSKILAYGNTAIQTGLLAVTAVGLVVSLVRFVLWIVAWQKKRKALLAA